MKKNRANLHQIVARAMTDPAFYDLLKKDPAAAVKKLNCSLTEKQIKALKAIDYGPLDALPAAFGEMLI